MNWKERDRKVNWHPFSSVNDEKIIPIIKADGIYLYDENGNKYIDAVSSWWVNLHGHNHPHIKSAIINQLNELDHVIFAGFTHPKAIELSERLLEFVPGNYQKVFYSDDGSTANEVALKMALQYFVNKGDKRKKIIAFENAYHGDTFGAMSLGGKNIFNQAFENWLIPEVFHIPVPVNGYTKEEWKNIESVFTNEVAAFIFEPLLQGAAGMIMYDGASLDRLIELAARNGIITIADEVLTGFGRIGKWFASDYLGNKADMICLSKGITGGVLPLGVTLVNEKIENAFKENSTFYHGHSYTANAISCAAACANIDLLNDETLKKIEFISDSHLQFIQSFQSENVVSCRSLGTVLAIEFKCENKSYTSEIRNKIYSFFLSKGILMRPLGNVAYVLPPYCITETELDFIYAAISEFADLKNGK